MGGYKDQPLAARMGPGKLTAQTEPAPGTRWFDGQRDVHSLAYGTSKVMGERLCRAYSAVTEGRLSTVAARIGWILPDGNDRATSPIPAWRTSARPRTARWMNPAAAP